MVQSTICVLLTKNHTCPNGKVFFNASIIWGVIGPQRQFSHGQIYYGLLFFFIIGAVTPVINWLILKMAKLSSQVFALASVLFWDRVHSSSHSI